MKTSDLYITATDARNNFFNLLTRVKNSPYPISITVKGIPEVVVMNKDDYDGWMATLETLSDKDLRESIKESDKNFKEGKYQTWQEVKKELGLEYRLDKTHFIEYTLESFQKELEKAGFKIYNYNIQFGEIWAIIK